MTAAETYTIAEEDRLRADLYNFMGVILSGPPDDMLLGQTAGLQGDSTDLGQAVSTLAKMARITKPKTVESEYNRLFIGLGRGELLPYASYYLTGFLNEKPLALLRQDMTAQGLARAQNVFEPEDNIRLGSAYFDGLMNRYQGNRILAAAAYNAGEGAVDRYKGVPPYRETKNYVQKIYKLYRKSYHPFKQDLLIGERSTIIQASNN